MRRANELPPSRPCDDTGGQGETGESGTTETEVKKLIDGS
jgi:hypothetical protein